jgi:hypothetical protein
MPLPPLLVRSGHPSPHYHLPPLTSTHSSSMAEQEVALSIEETNK